MTGYRTITTVFPCGARNQNRTRQRGMVTAVVVLFLIATLVFALSQMFNVSSGNAIDGQRQGDSTAAFFLAESGLERGRASLLSAPSFTDAACSGVAVSNVALGRGLFTLSGATDVTPCGGSGQPVCSTCTITSAGTVGIAKRTVIEGVGLGFVNGVACTVDSTVTPPKVCTNLPSETWWLDLKNPHDIPAIGVFSLAVGKQGANSGASCTNANCRLAWDAQNTGVHAIESMGNVVTVAANGNYRIFQTNSTQNLAEVGMLFRGLSAVPVWTGRRSYTDPTTGVTSIVAGAAYWDSGNTNSTISKFPAGATGRTNDGTATDSAAQVCLGAASTAQTCTSWCYGGDTLIFGFAAEATALGDNITGVAFNTGGTAPQIPLIPFISAPSKYPATTSPDSPPADVYTSIWYARNPDFLSASDVVSGARVTGFAGTAITFQGSISNSATLLTVSGIAGGLLAVGDVIAGGIDTGTKICAFGTGTGGNGTYTVSSTSLCSPAASQTSAHNNKAMSVTKTSTILTVTAATTPNLAIGDKIFGAGIAANTTITAPAGTGVGGVGTYTVSSAQQFASTPITSDGMTVTTSGTGSVAPLVNTILSVKSGTGVFPSGSVTTVIGTPSATTFTLSQRPTTPLSAATLCGGTCAFFVHGGNTQFTVSKTPANLSWAAGFICLKGVDIAPETVTSSKLSGAKWKELVQ